jgi:hypothetical protein
MQSLPSELWTLIAQTLIQPGETPTFKQLMRYAHTSQAFRQAVLPTMQVAFANKKALLQHFKKFKLLPENYNNRGMVQKWCCSKTVRDAFHLSPLRLTSPELIKGLETLNRGLAYLNDACNIEWGNTFPHLNFLLLGAY